MLCHCYRQNISSNLSRNCHCYRGKKKRKPCYCYHIRQKFKQSYRIISVLYYQYIAGYSLDFYLLLLKLSSYHYKNPSISICKRRFCHRKSRPEKVVATKTVIYNQPTDWDYHVSVHVILPFGSDKDNFILFMVYFQIY